jgi:hypothetical protein
VDKHILLDEEQCISLNVIGFDGEILTAPAVALGNIPCRLEDERLTFEFYSQSIFKTRS